MLTPREAFLGSGEAVPVEDAVGRVSCESIAGYPPGVPALLPGERITAEVVEYLRELTAAGARLHGAADPNFATVRVLVRDSGSGPGGRALISVASTTAAALDPAVIRDAVARALREDLGDGDVTTAATVPADARARAVVAQKAPGVVFGLEVAEATFRALDPEIAFEPLCAEGSWRERGAVRARGGIRARDPERRAHRAQLPRTAFRRRDVDGALR